MCAAAGAITAVICLISTGWNTSEVGKKLREIDRLVSDKYVGELVADNVADYAAAGYITVWETSGRRIFRRKTTKPTA